VQELSLSVLEVDDASTLLDKARSSPAARARL
jgi:hypothetical protein